MHSSLFRTALVLGLLSAIGPFAIDMYLPALPSIGQSLNASMGEVQLSLTAFFIALGIGQIVYGPVSDMVGRKAPMVFGIVLFALASIGCALAPDIHTLVALRFVQGLGACAGMVIPRAVVRDLHTGVDAARLMSLLMLVFSVCPILAPLAGSFVIDAFGWRAVFWSVLVIALAGLVLLFTSLSETRPAEQRAASSWAGAFAAYGLLLRDRHFLGLVFIGSSGISSFFAYLANSPFVMINHFGLTPRQFSIAFALNAASFIGSSQMTGRLATRFGMVPLVRFAVRGYAIVMLALLALTLAGADNLYLLIGMMLLGYGFLGLVVPATAVLALDSHGAIAGTASALMGTLQFACGALVMGILGGFVDGRPLPMVTGIAASATLAFVFAHFTLGRGNASAPAGAKG